MPHTAVALIYYYVGLRYGYASLTSFFVRHFKPPDDDLQEHILLREDV
jgi:hypothetical protein